MFSIHNLAQAALHDDDIIVTSVPAFPVARMEFELTCSVEGEHNGLTWTYKWYEESPSGDEVEIIGETGSKLRRTVLESSELIMCCFFLLLN